VIEKIFQIRIHNPYSTAVNLSPNLAQGILGGAPSPIAEVGLSNTGSKIGVNRLSKAC